MAELCSGTLTVMDEAILITQLNDFIFCPVSIYFHNLYGDMDNLLVQNETQINGTAAHYAVDHQTYSTRKNVLMGFDVYSEEYNLIGKVDIYDGDIYSIRERKKKIKSIYDGYVFQLYAQCVCMRELGYVVEHLELYSMDDGKTYPILLPEHDCEMMKKFENLIQSMHTFQMGTFEQNNPEKCRHCIYEPACDRSIL